MGKRRANKRGEKLFEKLVALFNNEFAKFLIPYCHDQKVSVDIAKITKPLKSVNKKKRIQVATRFKNYLETLRIENIGDHVAEAKFDNVFFFNNDMKTTFDHLLKEVSRLIEVKEKTQSIYSPVKQGFQLTKTIVGSAKEAVVTGALGIARQTRQGLTALVNEPVAGVKGLAMFLMYSLAGQPVEGMQLMNRQTVSNLQKIGLLDESEWYRLYDSIKGMIDEFSTKLNANQLDTKTQAIFFDFLKAALDAGVKDRLSVHAKKTLFDITKRLLNASYDLRGIENIKYLYNLFNVFLRLDFSKEQANTILTQVANYAKLFVEQRNILTIDQDKRVFAEFFWILNANFHWYARNLTAQRFSALFNDLMQFNYYINQWDKDSLFSFRSVLTVYNQLRSDFQKDPDICYRLDQAAGAFVTHISRLASKAMPIKKMKESFYIEYIRNLPEAKRADSLFAGQYSVISEEDVFPKRYRYLYLLPGSAVKIEIFLQQPLSQEEKRIVEEAIENTHARVKQFQATTGIQAYKEVSSEGKAYHKVYKLYIFNSNEDYVNYGRIWGVNTGGGGYTHVRLPQRKQTLPDYGALNPEKWYEAFVYKQPEGDSRDGENKEGRGFRNLGHEIQHKLFYNLIGHYQLHHLPSWFVEGSANALGNEACFKEEADYIEQRKGRLPSIQRIIAMSYASGADHYYFGSALVRFMLEKYPQKVADIVKDAQKDVKLAEINISIKEWASGANRETEFKAWLTNKIQYCSLEKNRKMDKPVEGSAFVTQRSQDRVTGSVGSGLVSYQAGPVRPVSSHNDLINLSIALQRKETARAEGLLKKINFNQVDINTPLNRTGDKLIHYAIRAKHWLVIWSLLLKGVSLDSCNNDGKTARSMARSFYNQQEFNDLMRYESDAKEQINSRSTSDSSGKSMTKAPSIFPASIGLSTLIPIPTAVNILNATTLTLPKEEENEEGSSAWKIFVLTVLAVAGIAAAGVGGFLYKRRKASQSRKDRDLTELSSQPFIDPSTPSYPESTSRQFTIEPLVLDTGRFGIKGLIDVLEKRCSCLLEKDKEKRLYNDFMVLKSKAERLLLLFDVLDKKQYQSTQDLLKMFANPDFDFLKEVTDLAKKISEIIEDPENTSLYEDFKKILKQELTKYNQAAQDCLEKINQKLNFPANASFEKLGVELDNAKYIYRLLLDRFRLLEFIAQSEKSVTSIQYLPERFTMDLSRQLANSQWEIGLVIETLKNHYTKVSRGKLSDEDKKIFGYLADLEKALYDVVLYSHSQGYCQDYPLTEIRNLTKARASSGSPSIENPDNRKAVFQDLRASLGSIRTNSEVKVTSSIKLVEADLEQKVRKTIFNIYNRFNSLIKDLGDEFILSGRSTISQGPASNAVIAQQSESEEDQPFNSVSAGADSKSLSDDEKIEFLVGGKLTLSERTSFQSPALNHVNLSLKLGESESSATAPKEIDSSSLLHDTEESTPLLITPKPVPPPKPKITRIHQGFYQVPGREVNANANPAVTSLLIAKRK